MNSTTSWSFWITASPTWHMELMASLSWSTQSAYSRSFWSLFCRVLSPCSFDERSRRLCCSDSVSLNVSMSARAGETALLIRVSRAFLDMAKDCKGVILLDAVDSDPCRRSNLVSMVTRLSSMFAEALRRDSKSEHVDSSLIRVWSSGPLLAFFANAMMFVEEFDKVLVFRFGNIWWERCCKVEGEKTKKVSCWRGVARWEFFIRDMQIRRNC